MKLVLLIALFILTSCGKFLDNHVVERAEPYFSTSDPFFDYYKNEFSEDYFYLTSGKKIGNLSIPVNFSDEIFFKANPNSIGVCFMSRGRGIEILINKSYWDGLDEGCRKNLIYHEFGHCLLNQRFHRDSHPSIMNTDNRYCNLQSTEYESDLIEELILRTRSSVDALLGYLNS